jgi:flagellum-specific ATP synthase
MLDFGQVVEQRLPHLRVPPPERTGTLVRLVGLTLETRGIMAPVGACCEVVGQHGHRIEAEVVGFNDKTLFLMPFTDPVGVGPGDMVRILHRSSQVALGSALLGRVIDGRGQPLDGKPAPVCDETLALMGKPLNPMERGPIEHVLDVGVKAINGVLTVGQGQRIGLVAGSGVGKSVLLGMLTRFTKADIVVIGLIGERGREVQAFISESLGEEGLAKSVVVAAPANVSPVMRLKATHMTHVIAEYFRDQGMNVLMLCDSLTRVAHAQREIGLAIGEPPTAKGYPPSVFALLPNLIERGGRRRRRQRPYRGHRPCFSGRSGDALAQVGRCRPLPGHRFNRFDFSSHAIPPGARGFENLQSSSPYVDAVPAKPGFDSGGSLRAWIQSRTR